MSGPRPYNKAHPHHDDVAWIKWRRKDGFPCNAFQTDVGRFVISGTESWWDTPGSDQGLDARIHEVVILEWITPPCKNAVLGEHGADDECLNCMSD